MSSVLHGFEKPSLAWHLLRTWATFEDDAIALGHTIRLAGERPLESAELVHALGINTNLETGAPEVRLARWASEIGADQFRRRLTTWALRAWAKGGLSTYGISPLSWSEGVLSSACAAEALARQTDASPSQAFITAVLGWVGMVPIARLMQRIHPALCFSGDLRNLAERQRWERAHIQSDTLSVAADLMRAWAYPTELVSAVRGIPHPILVQKGRPLAMLAHLGFHLEPVIRDGDPTEILSPTSKKCFESLGLSPSIIALITVQTEELMAELHLHPGEHVA